MNLFSAHSILSQTAITYMCLTLEELLLIHILLSCTKTQYWLVSHLEVRIFKSHVHFVPINGVYSWWYYRGWCTGRTGGNRRPRCGLNFRKIGFGVSSFYHVYSLKSLRSPNCCNNFLSEIFIFYFWQWQPTKLYSATPFTQ